MINVNPISFGKVILVKAPLKEAQKIADIANEDHKTRLAKKVKRIINDTQDGKAYAYSFNPLSDKSYIFSGKEGYEFGKSHSVAFAETNYIETYWFKSRSSAAKIARAWELHAQNVNKIISSAQNRPIIDIEYNKKGEISNVNLNA